MTSPTSALAEPAATDLAVRVPDRATALLAVRDLHVTFRTERGPVEIVQGLSFDLHPGEIVALVGESGSGKSVSALSIMRLLPRAALPPRGAVLFNGRDLLTLEADAMRRVRGSEIAMIFQEPMTSLNPILPIGLQVTEGMELHLGLSREAARKRAEELLRLVGAERRLDQFPHQLSGGMRQRVMIAIALACNPKLIIADEPTTALDATIQAQVLALLHDLSRRLNIGLLIITHNLGVVARYADRVLIMYAGQLVESGTVNTVFGRARHPYTRALLEAVPRLDKPATAELATIEGLPPDLAAPPPGCRFRPRCRVSLPICTTSPPWVEATDGGASCWRAREIDAGALTPEAGLAPAATPMRAQTVQPLLRVSNLTKRFNVSGGLAGTGGTVRAVEDVSFEIFPGETLGLVGESGCGKTTIGRLILRLEEATSGEICFAGENLLTASAARLRVLRRSIQVIFQDPYSSLNPRMTIAGILAEPLKVHGIMPAARHRTHRVAELLERVGLRPEIGDRYPHQLSGGQRQRIGIARALAMEPSFIVCDEAVSALDVSIQGQIVNLLAELQRRDGIAYLFIAHDLAVVRHISARIVVMYLGKVMEVAGRDAIYADPLHPYTRLLLDAAPIPDPVSERQRDRRLIQGELPNALAPPGGCVFNTRCPAAVPECRAVVPKLREIMPGHLAACIRI